MISGQENYNNYNPYNPTILIGWINYNHYKLLILIKNDIDIPIEYNNKNNKDNNVYCQKKKNNNENDVSKNLSDDNIIKIQIKILVIYKININLY